MYQPLAKWRPIQPFRIKDKIISSDARLNNDVTGFIPTYESDPRVNMYFILGNEYLRMWFEERKRYEKIAYAQLETLKEVRNIHRPFVPRFRKTIEEEEDVVKAKSVKERVQGKCTKYPVRKKKEVVKPKGESSVK